MLGVNTSSDPNGSQLIQRSLVGKRKTLRGSKTSSWMLGNTHTFFQLDIALRNIFLQMFAYQLSKRFLCFSMEVGGPLSVCSVVLWTVNHPTGILLCLDDRLILTQLELHMAHIQD